jgi:hypothetical protein
MNGPDGLSTDRHRVNMAFSIEEAPCGSTGFLTLASRLKKQAFHNPPRLCLSMEKSPGTRIPVDRPGPSV